MYWHVLPREIKIEWLKAKINQKRMNLFYLSKMVEIVMLSNSGHSITLIYTDLSTYFYCIGHVTVYVD